MKLVYSNLVLHNLTILPFFCISLGKDCLFMVYFHFILSLAMMFLPAANIMNFRADICRQFSHIHAHTYHDCCMGHLLPGMVKQSKSFKLTRAARSLQCNCNVLINNGPEQVYQAKLT